MVIAHPLQEIVDAHVQSILLLAISFRKETPQAYNFEDQAVSEKIRALIPCMLQNRLTLPPRETYSLNRKLSDAFLLCGRLKARVDCTGTWEDVTRGYQFTASDETWLWPLDSSMIRNYCYGLSSYRKLHDLRRVRTLLNLRLVPCNLHSKDRIYNPQIASIL